MEGFLNLIFGAAFAALLFSNENGAVPAPKSEWNDDVGESVSSCANKAITRFNKSYAECQKVLERIQAEADGAGFRMNFDSKENELYGFENQIDKFNIDAVEDALQRILGE